MPMPVGDVSLHWVWRRLLALGLDITDIAHLLHIRGGTAIESRANAVNRLGYYYNVDITALIKAAVIRGNT